MVGVDEDKPFRDAPTGFSLSQNYPNPFNPATVITYSVGDESDVRLAVYDLLGQEVAVLVDGWKTAGTYELPFDASGLASGPYIYRLACGNSAKHPQAGMGPGGYIRVRTMLFLR